jgi:cell wall-associated NlpC family hydrolase
MLPAGAGQLANERARARGLANEIATLGLKDDAMSEQYDAARVALVTTTADVAKASRQLARSRAAQAKTMLLLQQDAIEAYVGSGPQFALSSATTTKSMSDALLREELVQAFASDQTDALDGYRVAAANAIAAKALLTAAHAADARQLVKLQQDKKKVEATEIQLEGYEQQMKGKIAVLVDQIQLQQRAADERAEATALANQKAAAAAQTAADAVARAQTAREAAASQMTELAPVTTTTVSGSTSGSSGAPAPVPTSSSAAAIAVAAAESRRGDPYEWGAAGPDAFDCSGLIMWAYAQAGVSLPHFSGSQYADTVHIPMSDLEPGDLVFPADTGEHVAMYVGNGEIVQAPYTGADVEIVPLDTSFFVLASRVG